MIELPRDHVVGYSAARGRKSLRMTNIVGDLVTCREIANDLDHRSIRCGSGLRYHAVPRDSHREDV